MIEPNGTMLDEEEGGDKEDDDDDEEWIDMEARNATEDHQTMREQAAEHVKMLHDFADGLEYQLQFDDQRMFTMVKREGVGFFRLARSCLSRERCMNTRGSTPMTWERETTSVMFYRARPPRSDRNT